MATDRSRRPARTREAAVTAKSQSSKADGYLHLMPSHIAGDAHWHVFKLSEQSPRIALAGTVTSCEQALSLAQGESQLRVSRDAWQQMRDRGVAPARPPDTILII